MDDATYAALALVLTLLGGGYTWWAFRSRGAAAGTRGLALTLLPPAALLTDTLRMTMRVADAVGDWAVRLVFSPSVWLGLILAGLSVVLFVLAGFGGRRGSSPAASSRAASSRAVAGRDGGRASGRRLGAAPPTAQRPVVDDDLAEIEAILRKRGIT